MDSFGFLRRKGPFYKFGSPVLQFVFHQRTVTITPPPVPLYLSHFAFPPLFPPDPLVLCLFLYISQPLSSSPPPSLFLTLPFLSSPLSLSVPLYPSSPLSFLSISLFLPALSRSLSLTLPVLSTLPSLFHSPPSSVPLSLLSRTFWYRDTYCEHISEKCLMRTCRSIRFQKRNK